MVELSKGRGVYLYEDHINTAKSKDSPTSAACFLLSCFYKNSELAGKNLTRANAREGLNADIVSSILGKYIAFGVFVILLLLGICTLVHVDQHDFLRDQPCKKLWDHPYKKSEENNSKQVFRSSFDLSDLGLLIVV